MKNILPLLFIFFFAKANSQTITSINPNQATAGTTLTTVITGQNTFFQTASQQGNLNFGLKYPNSCSAPAYGYNMLVFNQDSVRVSFLIPSSWPNGPLNLNIVSGVNNINVDSAITLIGGTNYSLQGITPDTASESTTLSATITGVNLQSLITPPGRIYLQSMHIDQIFPVNVQFVNSNTVTADFIFSAYCDSGYYSLVTQSASLCFFLPNSVHVNGIYPKNLVSIVPSVGSAGTTLTATVTGQNTFFQSGSPQGFQSIQLTDQYCHVINGTNDSILDDDHFTVDFNIPPNAVNGAYDLHVRMLANGYTYLKPAWFTVTGGLDRVVQSFSPSTAIAGTTVNATIIGLGIDSIITAGPVKLRSNAGFEIMPANINSTSTQATMDFVVPIYADNGFYTLILSSVYGCFNISGAILVTGASPRGLVSITPNTGIRGQALSAVITGAYTFFGVATPQGTGNINRVGFYHVNTGQQFFVYPPNAVATDSNHVTINTTIPFSAPPGFYNLTVETTSGMTFSLTPGFEVTGTRISGNVFFDLDSNGVFNSGDVYMSGHNVLLLPDSIISITDSNGQFNFGVDSGQYIVRLIPDTNWVITTSPSQFVLTIGSTDTTGLKFGLQPTHEEYDLRMILVGNFPRCNNYVGYYLTYTNLSSTTVNGVVAFIPDSNLLATQSTPPADFTSGDTMFWNFNTLAMRASNTIWVSVVMPATVGTILNSYAIVKADDGAGGILATAADTLTQTVSCSYDPNDKSVEPEGVLAGHYTLINNDLEYLIRFQNTGTDTAFQVIILDTLDNVLNPLSLQILASSHSVATHIDGQVVEFRFDNILLPDSNVNEPLSHGYVTFKVLPKDFSNIGSVVNNNAGIYFDLNRPVITNTVFNTLIDQLPTSIAAIYPKSDKLLIYPNPSQDKFNILFKNPSGSKTTVRIFNSTGSLMLSENSPGGYIEIDAKLFSPGIYFILVDSPEGAIRLRGKVVIEY